MSYCRNDRLLGRFTCVTEHADVDSIRIQLMGMGEHFRIVIEIRLPIGIAD